MSGLEDLYREIILDHYRSPRHRGELSCPPAIRAEGFNPLCGDEVVVYLQLDDPSKGDDAVVEDVRIGGQGCSISQSSASMMSAAVIGKSKADIDRLSRAFKAMMSIHEETLAEDESAADGPGNTDTADTSDTSDSNQADVAEEPTADEAHDEGVRTPDPAKGAAGSTAAEPAIALGDLDALRGVVKFPVRIKCATLPWNTLAEGFSQAGL